MYIACMKMIFTATLMACSSLAFAQQGNSLKDKGCGTPPPTDAEMQLIYDFVSQIPNANKATAGVDTIALSLHVVGKSDGTGYISPDDLLKDICELNQKYAAVGFHFAVKWPIRYINETNYYVHQYQGGLAMMQQNNVAGTVNLYFVSDPSGNCGYYNPAGDAVALAKSCSRPGNSTIAHEVGHLFTLPHTFYGWEGGVTPANPEKVTRGAGANCNTAGDGFCDTPADYLSDRWNCPYTGNKVDQNGDPYNPDGTNYMSYSDDACTNHFSPQQIAKMNNNRQNRSSLSLNGVPSYAAMNVPQLYYPFNVELFANHKKAIWAPVDGAQYYYVKVFPNVSPGITLLETITPNTEINFDFNFAQTGEYTLILAPLNARNLCRAKTLTHTFRYNGNNGTLAVANTANTTAGIRISPNPVRGAAVSLTMNEVPAGNYIIAAYNYNGQKVFEQSVNAKGGVESHLLPANNWTSGLYAVRLTGANGQWTDKVVVQ